MKVEVIWSEAEGVMCLVPQDVVLADAKSVQAFRDAIIPALRSCGRKVPLVICIDGMTIRPNGAQLYGEAAKDILSYTSAFARYGSPGMVQMMITTEALRNRLHSNIFQDRAAAVRFVQSRSEVARSA